MPKVTLIINGETEFEVTAPMVTIGRTSDNGVQLNDTNVSRYHARIEQREDGYWLVEQNSSNGTSVNGTQVDGEILLQDGDLMMFGGSSTIQFNQPSDESEDEETDKSTESDTPAASTEAKPAGSNLTLIAGGVVGVAVIFAAAAGLFYWSRSGPACEAAARIKSPESNDILSKPVEVKLEIQNPQCVDKVVFEIDGKEFASSTEAPYDTTLDPGQFGDLVDGRNHILRVVLRDKDDKPLASGAEIEVGFETLARPLPPQEDVTPTPSDVPTPKPSKKGRIGDIEIQELITRWQKQNFPAAPGYKFDPQFLSEVNKKTAEYAVDGYYNRAAQYKDLINVAYQRDRDVGVPIGYILAMSRSKFSPQKQGTNEGLWQMSSEFAVFDCGTETLSDASQNCAVNVSANYLKDIYLDRFERDIVYSLAAFGMPIQEAAKFEASVKVTPNRIDFWKVLTPKQREEVARFFAAGIVTENPARFGLKKDRPLSELYPK